MKEFKKCQVVMLPTNEKTDICINGSKGLLYGISERDLCNKYCIQKPKYQHLYIISDEEIKEDDWIIEVNRFNKCSIKRAEKLILKELTTLGCKKIIASTDKSLNLPRPSDSFIRKYCSLNGNIKDILVEYNNIPVYINWDGCDGDISHYEKELQVSSDNTITIKKYEEKLYTKQQVISLCDRAWEDGYSTKNEKLYMRTSNNWINENIK